MNGVVDLKFRVIGINDSFTDICNYYYLEILGGAEPVLHDDLCSHCIPGNSDSGFMCSVTISGDPQLDLECKLTLKPTGESLYRNQWMHRPLSRPGVALGAQQTFPLCFKPGCALQAQRGDPRFQHAPRIVFPPDGAVLMPRDFLLELELSLPADPHPHLLWAAMLDGRDLAQHRLPASPTHRRSAAAVAVPALAVGEHLLRVEVRRGGAGGVIVAAADAAIVVTKPSPVGEACRQGMKRRRWLLRSAGLSLSLSLSRRQGGRDGGRDGKTKRVKEGGGD